MRVYISGKITGNEYFKTDFQRGETEIIKRLGNVEIINPARVNAELPPLTHEEYMRFSFMEMDLCETVFMLKNWRESCGASQEHGYAIAKGMKIIYE